ncbi:hypothetical protein RHECIAT_CH0001410 [Rhizobium etli CIAT 652]|uniref:Uncharacterized protein n=1 Tax=Rhizobium etli (strain CIAT 652) TaxID=491916 RepID=B3PU86_RHIE6|nr:hypothetical protein RHECIAT_CH0001410 [Rhizobium etli CIAT 652]
MVAALGISSTAAFPQEKQKRKYCNGHMHIAGRCTAKNALDACRYITDRSDIGEIVSTSRHVSRSPRGRVRAWGHCQQKTVPRSSHE